MEVQRSSGRVATSAVGCARLPAGATSGSPRTQRSSPHRPSARHRSALAASGCRQPAAREVGGGGNRAHGGGGGSLRGERVCEGFIALMPYDAALSTMEPAVLYAEEAVIRPRSRCWRRRQRRNSRPKRCRARRGGHSRCSGSWPPRSGPQSAGARGAGVRQATWAQSECAPKTFPLFGLGLKDKIRLNFQ
jgi:hypothetical protein